MENLYIEPTEFSPKVNFDLKNQKFELTGTSRPEDVVAFYESIIYQVEKYVNSILNTDTKPEDFHFYVKFDLDYMNSASSKYILQILDCFKKLYQQKMKISIDWYYEDIDDQIFEDGGDLSDVIKIPFNLKPRK
ncbi:MAG: DUF1987 domain-containing protein [Bacteroidales bacterium]|jgi:hypothetical protein|nr:DUF1987 domain-containing protein [Bacteroidales bacterium]